ncbi:MAG: nodulation protein NfeD [Candidatus Binatia bacterium]
MRLHLRRIGAGLAFTCALAGLAPAVESEPSRKGAAPAAATKGKAAADVAKGDAAKADAAVPNVVHRAVVNGPITPATVDYLRGAIEGAQGARAAALVIILDTPGGLLESTKLIVQDLLAAPVPVVVYVSPGGASATSAGVFVTMAAHIAAMAPGTSIGAAHPVGGRGEDIEGDMGKKVENFVAGFGTAIAERRGRNVKWAERAVRESVTATENEAVANKIVDFVAADLSELLMKASGREVEVAGSQRVLEFRSVLDAAGQPRVVDVEMTLRQRVVAFVSDPNIAYLLMMGAMLGLYVEFSNPGLIFPGVAGAICLLLALLAAQVLPISSTGALLLAVGMAFIIAEMFFPSFGALGVGGVVALALGSLFLYTPESALAVDRRLVTTAIATIAAFVALVMGVLMTDRRRRPTAGGEGMVDEIATAMTDLDPRGKIKVRGEIWNATSSGNVRKGEKVRIVRLHGLETEVVPVQKEGTS